LSGQIAALVTAIDTLQAAGAGTMIVRGLQGSGTLATFYTQTLWSELTAAGVDFIASDVRSLIQTIQANPTLYGFTASTVLPGVLGTGTGSACVWNAAGGTGWGRWCANTTTPSTQHAYLRSADAQLTSLFSDDGHFSAAGQRLVANYEYSLIPTPLPTAFPLFATGLGAIGLWNWRRRKRVAGAAVPANAMAGSRLAAA
jgi:outer membrane lipase/esterase